MDEKKPFNLYDLDGFPEAMIEALATISDHYKNGGGGVVEVNIKVKFGEQMAMRGGGTCCRIKADVKLKIGSGLTCKGVDTMIPVVGDEFISPTRTQGDLFKE